MVEEKINVCRGPSTIFPIPHPLRITNGIAQGKLLCYWDFSCEMDVTQSRLDLFESESFALYGCLSCLGMKDVNQQGRGVYCVVWNQVIDSSIKALLYALSGLQITNTVFKAVSSELLLTGQKYNTPIGFSCMLKYFKSYSIFGNKKPMHVAFAQTESFYWNWHIKLQPNGLVPKNKNIYPDRFVSIESSQNEYGETIETWSSTQL